MLDHRPDNCDTTVDNSSSSCQHAYLIYIYILSKGVEGDGASAHILVVKRHQIC